MIQFPLIFGSCDRSCWVTSLFPAFLLPIEIKNLVAIHGSKASGGTSCFVETQWVRNCT